MNNPIWHDYDIGAEMARDVAAFVATIIADALSARGHAVLALPGGKSPISVFDALAKVDVDWAKVTLFPADDRIVAEDSPLSNVALLRRHFGGLGANILSIVGEAEQDRYAVAAQADTMLADVKWPLDLVWLGMGTDGHTASIFPGPDYDAAIAMDGPRAVAVLPDPLPPEAPVARVTLTRGAIASSRTVILTISGAAKSRILEQALKDGEASAFPIGRVLSAAHNAPHIYRSQS